MMDADTRKHIIAGGEDPDRLRTHLVFGHGITPDADHREMDDLHITAHRVGAVTRGHVDLREG